METKFLFFLNFDRVPRNSTCLTQPARLRNTISIRDSADFSKASAFHEGVEKVKENNKNRKTTKWAGKVWREKPRVRVQLGQKLRKKYNFFEF